MDSKEMEFCDLDYSMARKCQLQSPLRSGLVGAHRRGCERHDVFEFGSVCWAGGRAKCRADGCWPRRIFSALAVKVTLVLEASPRSKGPNCPPPPRFRPIFTLLPPFVLLPILLRLFLSHPDGVASCGWFSLRPLPNSKSLSHRKSPRDFQPKERPGRNQLDNITQGKTPNSRNR